VQVVVDDKMRIRLYSIINLEAIMTHPVLNNSHFLEQIADFDASSWN
jgi:hypothetical protein